MAAPFINTQTGATVQLNTLGNSLKGTAQGTAVQLGALNNTSTFYRDPANPCNGQGTKTNNMSSFRNRQLVYISSQGTGPTIPFNTNGFSIYNPSNTVSGTTSVQGTSTSTQGYVVNGAPSKWYGTGGPGGRGTDNASSGTVVSGTNGFSAINFSAVGQITTQQGTIYGGGGGGGGGGSYIFGPLPQSSGGGGGAFFGAGGAGSINDAKPGNPAQGAAGGTGGAVNQGYGYKGGNGGNVGQPGQPGASQSIYVTNGGGGAGLPIGGAQAITYQGTTHN
jgi:hypothetical protein